ncbi:MAG: hypothetical protein NT154_39700, partial [Verrucomicrobia bacterium]|nr:hypothetical protein [Verrucomicrobiota bacterium]
MKKVSTCLLWVALMTMVTAITVSAATTAPLPPQIVLRPLTPGDITIYKLPSTTTETSPGLNTVAIGGPMYLEVELDKTIAPSNIVSVTWVLTNTPVSSTASLTNSPLGANVPIYDVADRLVYQVAGRSFLRADVVGQYTIAATVVVNSNSTQVVTSLTKTITAATYMGLNTCALCHSGGAIAPNKVTPWENTKHAHIFEDGINGGAGTSGPRCFGCHTVGYNANTNTIAIHANGGFDDVARAAGWTWPNVLAPTNWAYMQATYPSVANLANIQCENCHGPGSQHAYSLGDTKLISKSVSSGDCNQCHDAPTHHIYGTQWLTSAHAGGQSTSPRVPSGPSRWACVGCHTAPGFIDRMDNLGSTNAYVTNTAYVSIGCQACHEPHGETVPADNPHLVRMLAAVTMPDGTVVTNAGFGALCLQCHQVRNGSCTNQLVNYPVGKLTWFGGSSFGVHDSPQGDMIEGLNAFTYGQQIPSAVHRTGITNLCVGCHMQPANYGDPAYLQAGSHTWKMNYNVVTTNGSTLVTNSVDQVGVCVQCHGEIEDFNMVRQDYNGDGVIEGVQDEVQHLLDKLSTLLPNSTYQANSNNYVADGLVKSSVSFKTNWPAKFLKAGYNWQFVANDGSKGIHNAPFAVGILRSAIADLTGDGNNDGLPDSWQAQYFTTANNPAAAPNATPAGDGVPNWMKYILGLNPLVPGISITNGLSVGVVWADGSTLNNPYGTTNTIQIYTAAEVT